MHIAGIRLCFTELERLFGTLKRTLRDYAIAVARHLDLALAQFRFWCNAVRPHQHLGGRTQLQVWRGINPYLRRPKRALWFEGWNGQLRGWVLHH